MSVNCFSVTRSAYSPAAICVMNSSMAFPPAFCYGAPFSHPIRHSALSAARITANAFFMPTPPHFKYISIITWQSFTVNAGGAVP